MTHTLRPRTWVKPSRTEEIQTFKLQIAQPGNIWIRERFAAGDTDYFSALRLYRRLMAIRNTSELPCTRWGRVRHSPVVKVLVYSRLYGHCCFLKRRCNRVSLEDLS